MKNSKRLLTLLLVASMLAGTVNLPVYAEENSEENIEEIDNTENEEEEIEAASEEGEETEYPEGVTEETINNEDGTVTEITATKTTVVDENGKVTVTLTIEKTTEDTTTDGEGEVVDKTLESESSTTVTETTTDEESGETTVTENVTKTKEEENAKSEYKQTTSTVTDAEGEVISSYTDGYEKDTFVGDVPVGEDVPSVEVKFEGYEPAKDEAGNIIYEKDEEGNDKLDGNGNPIPVMVGILSGSVEGDTVMEKKGDLPENEDDKNYNYTQTTTTSDRVVTGTITDEYENFKITTDPKDENTLKCPVEPKDYEGKQEGSENDGSDFTNHNFEGLEGADNSFIKDDLEMVRPKPDNDSYDDGYDLTWTGQGDSTMGAAAVVIKKLVPQYNEDGSVKYETDENGNLKLDVNGERIPVIDWENSQFMVTGNSKGTVYDENGRNYLVDENGDYVDWDGKPVTEPVYVGSGMVLAPSQFALEHENGNHFYAYCMDASTGAQPTVNRWYYIRNLEDAIEGNSEDGYLTEEEANLIRAIATHGYWGTDANVYETNEDNTIKYETNEDGTYKYKTNKDGTTVLDEEGNPVRIPVVKKDEEGKIVTDSTVQGSLASLKALLEETYGEDGTVSLHYPGSNQDFGAGIKVSSLLDGLTESEALAATQAALWAIANKNDLTTKYGQGEGVVGVLSALRTHNSSSWLMEFQSAYNVMTNYNGDVFGDYYAGETGDAQEYAQKYLESDIRMQALYQCLLGLDPMDKDGATDVSEYVIPTEDAITDVGLVIHDKAEGFEENTDKNVDNDVYNTDLNFTLAFVPDPKNDDILVYLYTINEKGESEIMLDADGKQVVRRLAGTNSGDRNADTITAVDGVYTLTGLQLGENSGHTFDLRLDGIQELKQGVYIYQAHGGRKDSQTLVGLAEGEQKVEFSNVMTLEFEVTECDVVVEHWWHSEEVEEPTDPVDPIDPPTDPIDPPTDPIDPPTDPIDPPTDPIDPPTDPIDPPTDPIDPPTDPIDPPTDPIDPPTDPIDPPTDPIDPPTDPIDPPTEPEPVVVVEEPVVIEEPVVEEEPVEVVIADEDIPLADIPDESVPLTGDSIAWYIVSVLAGLGLAVVSFFDRKKKNNA